MATAAATTPEPIVGHIILLHPDQIEVGPRLRPVDPVWAAALGGILQAEGQRTPIEVCRLPGKDQYTLVTGAHRHAGAALHGLLLRAEVVSNDAIERKLREASENLHRRDLTPIERAAHIAELVALHKARAGIDPETDGRAVSARVRWEKSLKNEADNATVELTVAYGWTDEVAGEIGYSSSVVERALYLYRRLSPSAIERLRAARHPVLENGSQLRKLARLDEGHQHQVVEALLSGAKRVFDPSRPKPVRSAEDRRFSSVIGAVSRMSQRERRALIQSPAFLDLLPAEARELLAPIRRGGGDA